MAAPDIPTLLDVETEVEGVFNAYLGTTLSLPTVKSDSNTILVTPRVEIVCTLTEEGQHQFTIPTGVNAGLTFYDQKRVQVKIDLIYAPDKTLQAPGTLRGKLRQVFGNFEAIKNQFAVNGYYGIASDSLRQIGGNRTTDDPELKTERISTTLDAVLFVMPAAWPLT